MITINRPELKWVEAEGAEFAIREERFEDVIQLMQTDIESEWAFLARAFVARIQDWKGVGFPNGEPAPCDPETKSALFGKRPGLLNQIAEAYLKEQDEALKNSEPSQDGQLKPDPTST